MPHLAPLWWLWTPFLLSILVYLFMMIMYNSSVPQFSPARHYLPSIYTWKWT